MKTVTITQLRNQLSELLEIAKNGETISVLDRNVPIVRIGSALAEMDAQGDVARMAKLERAGLVARGRTERLGEVLVRPPVKPTTSVDLVGAVLDERDDGR